MSNIPFIFDTPVPKYFRKTEKYNNAKMILFVTWAFSKCSTTSRTITIDNTQVMLGPFEFIAGRTTSPKECLLTEKEFRGQIKTLINDKLLIKGANSRANRFTTYIWVTSAFSINEGQLKGQLKSIKGPTDYKEGQLKGQLLGQPYLDKNGQPINQSSTDVIINNNNQPKGQLLADQKGQLLGQPKGHNQEYIRLNKKESHQSISTSSDVPDPKNCGLTDDFSFSSKENQAKIIPLKPEEEKQDIIRPFREDTGTDGTQHNVYYQSIEPLKSKTCEIYPGVILSEEDLQKCIAIKGSLESVKQAVEFIQKNPKRTSTIRDWPTALAKWKIENKNPINIQKNIEYADRLCKTFEKYKRGWRCYLHRDKTKDLRGVLFDPESAYQESTFVALIDREFQEKCFNFLKEKKLIPQEANG